jgi:hypothetical protein
MAVDRYSVATGSWSATSTWSATEGGAAGASVPVATDTAHVLDGFTVTVDDASRACYKVNIGKAGDSDGTLSMAASSVLTLDDTSGAKLNFERGGILTDAVGITGAFAAIQSAGGLNPTNKWTVTVDVNFTGSVTTQRVKCLGCTYGIVGTAVTFRSMTIRNLRRNKDIDIRKQKPIGATAGISRWMSASIYEYTMDFLYDYDTDPYLLDTLIRMGAQNTSYLFFGDLFQDVVYIEEVPAGAAPEMRKEWLSLALPAKEG